MLSLHPLIRVLCWVQVNMASKFVIAFALFAVCHSSPVDEYRGKRSYTAAVGSSTGYTGKTKASAVVDGSKADAQALNENGDILAQDAHGNGLPNHAFAKVGTYDTPSDAGAAGFGYAQPSYYSLPAPANVITYQKYVPAEIPSQIVYEAQPAPALAQSSAATNGGYGSANSVANTDFGSAASNANAQGSGHSTASSLAQTAGTAVPVESAVIAAKGQGFHSVYTPTYVPVGPNSASSTANVKGYQGSAASSARASAVPTRKSISWRFGTAYDQPAAYGAAKATAANYGQGSAAARSDVSNQGSLSSTSSTHGAGLAQSHATEGAYGSSVKSLANTFGAGSSSANANVNNPNHAYLRSDNVYAGYGGIKSIASSQNGGSAISKASTDFAGNESVDSAARSHFGGSALSGAYSDGGAHGLRSNGAWGAGGRLVSDSSAYGNSNAASNARTHGVSTGYRVVNSFANSDPYGSARSNAYAV